MSLSRIYQSVVFAIFLLFSIASFAQQPVVKTSVDKNQILIGEQVQFNVEADFPANTYKINWLNVPDSMGHFEVVSRGKIDSVFTNNQLTTLSQIFTITSFDSGQWKLPAFVVEFDSLATDSATHYYTNTLAVTVSYATDTTKQLRDIKTIREVQPPSMLLYWIGGAILVLLLMLFFIWLYKKIKTRNKRFSKVSPATAYEEAMNELKKLKEYNVNDPAQLKIYHSKLAVIFKQYLSHIKGRNYLNKTTDEVLISFKDSSLIDHQSVANLAAALRCGDAVKFAKYLPLEDSSADALNAVKEAIELLNKGKI